MSCENIQLWGGIALTLDSHDPEYEHWEFGKLSALREIAFALEHEYPYYYMGQSVVLSLH